MWFVSASAPHSLAESGQTKSAPMVMAWPPAHRTAASGATGGGARAAGGCCGGAAGHVRLLLGASHGAASGRAVGAAPPTAARDELRSARRNGTPHDPPADAASCSSRCEMLFDDLENSFTYDDGEGGYDDGEGERSAYRYYIHGHRVTFTCDPVWELSLRECCKNSCNDYHCDDYDDYHRGHCFVAVGNNYTTIVSSLIAICLQTPLIIFSFKAKTVIDAEAKL